MASTEATTSTPAKSKPTSRAGRKERSKEIYIARRSRNPYKLKSTVNESLKDTSSDSETESEVGTNSSVWAK